jgi:Tfp pilus assembly protein PilV
MRRFSFRSCVGDSLIEVMLAVALMAVTTLGLMAAHLWTARDARAMAMREQAVWIADSIAESMHAPGTNDTAVRQWSARAAALLPKGETSMNVVDSAVSTVRVTWAMLRNVPRSGEVIDKPEPCGGQDAPAGAACVALAVAK